MRTTQTVNKAVLVGNVAFLMLSSVAAQEVAVGQLVAYFIGLAISIGISVYLYSLLTTKDAQLPPQHQYTPQICAIYWICCFFCGCLGSLVVFLIANQEIDRRLIMVNGMQGGLPVGTVAVTPATPVNPYVQPGYSGQSGNPGQPGGYVQG